MSGEPDYVKDARAEARAAHEAWTDADNAATEARIAKDAADAKLIQAHWRWQQERTGGKPNRYKT